ncbi:ABC transporter permease [Niabella hibiscisoli]|uniref:ABC transporter permease n=1 Tax=Niabella hibiscisoli TaxID=1825928 RepID=UPI001F103A92|nr:ABC transporter permease [Niabella hibiscisoli]MCH5721400.1 ABC transporter permease [Niabella hibiscisoli]
MVQYLIKKILYSILVLAGVVVLVFFLFQGFGDPARLVMGQTGDAKTQENIRKELYLDQPKWKQFLLYVNDVSPIAIHYKDEIDAKQLKGVFIGGERKLGIKIPYLRRSYQSKREVGSILMQALPGTIMLTIAAMAIAVVVGIPLGVVAAVKQNTWLDTGAIFSSIVGISAPSFFMGIVIAYFFGFVLTKYTGLQISGNWFDIDEVTGSVFLALKTCCFLLLPWVSVHWLLLRNLRVVLCWMCWTRTI